MTRGVVERARLYFVGLPYSEYAVTSEVLPGRGRDARYIAEQIASRQREAGAVEPAEVLAA